MTTEEFIVFYEQKLKNFEIERQLWARYFKEMFNVDYK